MQKEIVKVELDSRKIIEGVLSGDISTETYDFRDIEYKKKTLANYLTCNIEDIGYEKDRNLFIVGHHEYNVLYKDEVKVQKIINMYYDIEFECFFMRPEAVSKIFDISINEVNKRYKYSDEACDCIDIKEILSSNDYKITIGDFMEKADKFYLSRSFLSCQYDEIKIEAKMGDLFIYEFGQ